MAEDDEKKGEAEEAIEESEEEQKTEESFDAEDERKEEVHEVEEDMIEEKEEATAEKKESEEEMTGKEMEEPKKEKAKKEKAEPKKAEPSEEDEFVAMMKQEEAEKKAETDAKIEAGEEPLPVDEEKENAEEVSLIKKPRKKKKKEEVQEEVIEESTEPRIYALRTTANREDQVMSFVTSNAARKKLEVYSVIRPHGMRGYIFIEAGSRTDAEQAAFGVPYARGLLPSIIQYNEIEHMLEQVKKEANIQKNDIAEIISGPFKREKCKITRIDKAKEEVVVELLEAAVPIPLTLKIDAVRVIRREGEEKGAEEKD